MKSVSWAVYSLEVAVGVFIIWRFGWEAFGTAVLLPMLANVTREV